MSENMGIDFFVAGVGDIWPLCVTVVIATVVIVVSFCRLCVIQLQYLREVFFEKFSFGHFRHL